MEIDPENMQSGAFELDWNDKFVSNLDSCWVSNEIPKIQMQILWIAGSRLCAVT
jgi:hypothetical protein